MLYTCLSRSCKNLITSPAITINTIKIYKNFNRLISPEINKIIIETV